MVLASSSTGYSDPVSEAEEEKKIMATVLNIVFFAVLAAAVGLEALYALTRYERVPRDRQGRLRQQLFGKPEWRLGLLGGLPSAAVVLFVIGYYTSGTPDKWWLVAIPAPLLLVITFWWNPERTGYRRATRAHKLLLAMLLVFLVSLGVILQPDLLTSLLIFAGTAVVGWRCVVWIEGGSWLPLRRPRLPPRPP